MIELTLTFKDEEKLENGNFGKTTHKRLQLNLLYSLLPKNKTY